MVYATDGDLNHQEILEQFTRIENIERDQRRLAIKDMLFVNDESGQWEEDAIQRRADRPRYTIDKISPAINQIIGDQRQNSIAIKVSPQGESTEEIADIYTGLIRSIEELSSASNAYDNAATETVTCGWGGWRILTEFPDDSTFDQEIQIKPINSAASTLYFDPMAESYDKRDAKFAFVVTQMDKKEYTKEYPDQPPSDFDQETYQSWQRDWIDQDTIKVAEYWYKDPIKKRLALMSDGTTIDLDEEEKVLDELHARGITIVRERTVDSHKVKMVWVSGGGILSDPVEWAGNYIPLVPMFGITTQVEEKRYCRGIVRKAIDAQRIYNYSTSANVEVVALAPKDPYFVTPAQVAGLENQYQTIATKNPPFVLYNADPAAPGPPSRGGAPQVQQALISQTQQAGMDIHATTGLEPASMGNSPELKSGKAIQAQQAMGDRGAYIFQDNWQKSIAYTGIILVDLIPRIYDSERVVQIMKQDGTLKEVTINEDQTPPQIDTLEGDLGELEDSGINKTVTDTETGEKVIVNDLSQGSYSVSVKSGPAFATKKQETVQQLIELSQGSELVKNLAMDLIIDNMDLNNGDEIGSRVRRQMIKQGAVEPTEAEIKEFKLDQQKPDPMQTEIVKNMAAQTEKIQVEVEKLISDIKNKDADTENKIVQANKDSIAALQTLLETYLKKEEAGIPVSPEEMELIEGQTALVADVQTDALQGQEVAGSAPMAAQQQAGAQQQPTPEQLAILMQQGG